MKKAAIEFLGDESAGDQSALLHLSLMLLLLNRKEKPQIGRDVRLFDSLSRPGRHRRRQLRACDK